MDRPRDVMASRFLVIRYSCLPFATNMWTYCSNFGKWPFSSILKSAAVLPSSVEDLGSSPHFRPGIICRVASSENSHVCASGSLSDFPAIFRMMNFSSAKPLGGRVLVLRAKASSCGFSPGRMPQRPLTERDVVFV